MLLRAILLVSACLASDLSLQEFARKSLVDGQPNRIPGPIAPLIGLQPDSPVHVLEVLRKNTTDDMNHLASVLVELTDASPPTPTRPLLLVLSTHYVKGGKSEGYWFRAALDARLERVIVIRGKRDKAGAGIRGSGSATELDVSSPDVHKRFQHELDFWLKGAYRRKGKRNKPGP